jgi:hypothetical protein
MYVGWFGKPKDWVGTFGAGEWFQGVGCEPLLTKFPEIGKICRGNLIMYRKGQVGFADVESRIR